MSILARLAPITRSAMIPDRQRGERGHMRNGLIGVLTMLLVATLPAVAQDADQQKKWCANEGGNVAPDLQIGGCTAIIQAGRESTANLAISFYNRGSAYMDVGQYDRAIQDFDQANRLGPNDASTLSNRGNAYSFKGQYDRAIQDYDQAIRLKPDHANAFSNRGSA